VTATEKPKGSRRAAGFCYVAPRRGERFVIQSVRILPLVVLGILAVGLSGCGRKGPLDLPPSAAITQPPGTAAATDEAPAIGPDGRPIAPPGTKKRLPIDWILD
jgi:predicted small lipoprotein YifL